METLHAKRLMKLARFLYNDLPEEKFDFTWVVQGQDMPNKKYDCGTVACAVGWMPHVFPRRFEWRKVNDPEDYNDHFRMGQIILVDKEMDVFMGLRMHGASLEDFFGLKNEEVSGLFSPLRQDYVDLPELTSNATAKDVAKNIARFVRRKKPGISYKLSA